MIDSLHKYKVVIETGSITKAASRLYMSQPALSLSLQKLEKDLGCKLLTRSKNGVKPTKNGLLVYQQACDFDLTINNLRRAINEQTQRLEKNVNMGLIDNVSLIFTSSVYKKIVLKFPKLRFKIFVDNSSNLINLIESGTIDFAIISKPPHQLPLNIHLQDFASEKMSLVGTVQNARQIKDISDLKKTPFISFNKDSFTHENIRKTFKNSGISIRSKIFSSNPDFILQMVRLGTGIAVLPRNLVIEDLRINILEEIELPGLSFQRELSLIYLKNSYISKNTRKLLEELKILYMDPKES